MSLTFAETPTLADLDAYAAELEGVANSRRELLRRSRALRERKRSSEFAAEIERLETEAEALATEMWRLESLHQVQAFDYRNSVGEGRNLPAHRAAIYAANAEATR